MRPTLEGVCYLAKWNGTLVTTVFGRNSKAPLIWKILGADYGMDIAVPFVYTDLRVAAVKDHVFKPGDILFEPLLLAWHPDQLDVVAAYGFWAPTGNFSRAHPAEPGKGFWSHMLTLGATWYPTGDKTLAAALLNRYEFHTRNDRLDATPGHSYTLEWGLSKTIIESVDVGLIGYYQQQVTADHGRGMHLVSGRARDRVVAMGPEVNAFLPMLPMFASLRYVREFSAKDRPKGNTVTLTVTAKW